MSASRRLTLWLVILSVLLLVTAFWTRGRMLTAQASAHDAVESLSNSHGLIAKINELKQDRLVLEDRPDREREVIGLIENSTADAGINRTSVARIEPQLPKRMADTEFAEYQVRIALRDVKLDQLLRFLHQIADDGAGLQAKTVHLRTPQNTEFQQIWNVETTLTYVSNLSKP